MTGYSWLVVCAAVLVVPLAWKWLKGAAAQIDEANSSALEMWVVDELAALVAEKAPAGGVVLVDTLSGRAPDPAIVQWALDHRLEAKFVFSRSAGKPETMVVRLFCSFDAGRREVERQLDWSEVPGQVRGEFLSGGTQVSRIWRPKWDRA